VAWTIAYVAVFIGVRCLTRDRAPLPLAMGFVAFSISFWNFGRWLPYEPATPASRWLALLVWAAVTAFLVRLLSLLASSALAVRFSLIFLAIWTVASVASYGLTTSEIHGGDAPDVYAGPAYTFGEERPNVYWFILDEHARSDQVRRWTRYDNTWFDQALEDRGFSVSTSSRSAYLHTHLSIPSTLEMTYPFTPGHDYRGEYDLGSRFLTGDNAVVDTFEANGYEVVYAPAGTAEWAACDDAVRTCIDPVGGPLAFPESRLNLARSTPIGSLALPIAHNDFASVLDGVDELPDDQPRFVMAHVMSPHGPFRYDADCGYRGEWIEGYHLSGDERAAAYANDVRCIDEAFVDATDRIVASDPDAVIIVQSDHGSRLSFDWLSTTFESSTPSSLNERFSVVNAIRLPAACRGDSIEGEALVNTFRVVFACLAGTEPELLEPRYYFTGFGRISTLAEVPPERFDEP
jgi:hypothetical protein